MKNIAVHNLVEIFELCVVGGIVTVMFVGLLCHKLVKTDFSFDSIGKEINKFRIYR